MEPLSEKQEDSSVLTKRTMQEIAHDNDRQWQSNRGSAHDLREAAREKTTSTEEASPPTKSLPENSPESERRPEFVEPIKPTLVPALPEGPEWSYEVKWDGYRTILIKHGKEIQLLSRNGNSLAQKFPTIVAAAAKLEAASCVLDGEIVALDQDGAPAFQELQNFASTKATIVFYAFDLLQVAGKKLTGEPLSARRAQLEGMIGSSGLRFSPELDGTAEQVLAAVEKTGLEGIVAKRRDSLYVAGDRTNVWQKLRVQKGQEFVIGGYRPGTTPFGSVLVGYYEKKKFLFAAKVRPGFKPASRRKVWSLIKGDETSECPFANLPDAVKKGRWGEGITREEMKTLRWVKPKHVVEIGFVEWTSDHHLRHSAFKGIRTDKKATDVLREEPIRPSEHD